MNTRPAPDQTDRPRTLVLGATGKTGRRVAAGLAALGIPTRRGSRAGHPPFDWEDRSSWEPVLRDADAVYLSYYPDLAVPGAADTVGAFAAAAVRAGARRIVLLSGRGEDGARAAERAVRQVAPGSTVVRCSWFAQNFTEGYLLDPVLAGEVALPVAGVPEPFVDAEDIAEVAVAALTGDGHARRTYEVTGPRLLSFATAVEEIAAAAGRRIEFVPLTIEDYTGALARYDVPADVVWLLTHLFTEVLDGRNAQLGDGVERALGRKPRDFADFARAAAADGVWDTPPRP